MRKIIPSAVITLLVALAGAPCFGSDAVTASSGMVVTAHPVASQFGLDILQTGGNAVDAAVGAAVILGVVEPHASGFGGGGSMLVYIREQDSLTYINYYARAPRMVPTDFDSDTESHTGQAVLIPGTRGTGISGFSTMIMYMGRNMHLSRSWVSSPPA
ncbi:MAG: gamma-glutamyltransferase [Candidatus Marinimicrobia bacterium]|nr:gamma-glutamyltransferase [Candidatus Neomarinimicrobiota bacterium]